VGAHFVPACRVRQGGQRVQGAGGAGSFVAQGVSIAGMRNGDVQILAVGNLLYHNARRAPLPRDPVRQRHLAGLARN
jgi:hypothetical protein